MCGSNKMNIMKKAISFVMISFLIITFSVCHAANTVNVDELGFSISLPSDLIVFTQETSTSDSLWEQFNVDPNEFISFLKNNSIYVDAVSPDGTYEIIVVDRTSSLSEEVFDLNYFEDEEILEEMSEQKDSIVLDQGGTILSDSIYHSGNIKYYSFVASVPNNGGTAYSNAYYSIFNGKGFRIAICSYAGPINDQHKQIIKSVVDSVHFTEEIQSPPVSSQSAQKTNSSFLQSLGEDGLRGAFVGLFSAVVVAVVAFIKKITSKGTAGAKSSGSLASNVGLVEQPENDDLPKDETVINEMIETIEDEIVINEMIETVEDGAEKDTIIKGPTQETETDSDSDLSEKSIRVLYCHKCGAKLIEGSLFCSKCGTKVWVGDKQ